MREKVLSSFTAGGAALILLAAVACTTSEPTAVRQISPGVALGQTPTQPYPWYLHERQADAEAAEICKDYPGGTGPDVVFDVNVSGDDNASFQITVPAGECREIWETATGDVDNVTVTENVPNGYAASYVKTLYNQAAGLPVVGNSAGGTVGSQQGFLLVFTNTLIPDEGCTLTQGYWKTHSGDWDEAGDPNTAGFLTGTTFYNSGETYLEIMNTPPRGGNAYIILAYQFIAAELNVGAGAATTAAVDAALAGADAYFSGAPAGIPNPTGATREQLLTWAGVLDSYNNGLTGPGHCPD